MADPQQLAAALQQQGPPQPDQPDAGGGDVQAAVMMLAQALGVPPEAVIQALEPLAMPPSQQQGQMPPQGGQGMPQGA